MIMCIVHGCVQSVDALIDSS